MNKPLPLMIQEYNSLMEAVVQNEGQLTPEIESELTKLNELIPEKAAGYAFVIDKLESDAEHFKRKAQEFSAIAKSISSVQSRMKQLIKDGMISMDMKELVAGDEIFYISKSKSALEIDESTLDDSFKMIVQETVPDKEMIQSYLKDGIAVTGAKLIDTFSLRRKPKKN
jgi:hypothetical protein